MDRKEAMEIIERHLRTWTAFKPTQPFIIENKVEEALKIIKQPQTLADFLGWEEGVEYIDENEDIFIVKDDELYMFNHFRDEFHKWKTYNERVEILRKAKKVEPKKYYAIDRIERLIYEKGCYLCKMEQSNWDGDVILQWFNRKTKSNADKLTKEQWAELGINDSNADFEQVEE